MKNLLEQAFRTPDNQGGHSFLDFKETVREHKHDTVTVRTFIQEKELNIIKAINRVILTKGKMTVIPEEISRYDEDYLANVEEFDRKRFIYSSMLTGLHRILALLHQNPNQEIVYFSPFGEVYELSNEQEAIDLMQLRQRLKEKGAIVFPIISKKPTPQVWRINKFRP